MASHCPHNYTSKERGFRSNSKRTFSPCTVFGQPRPLSECALNCRQPILYTLYYRTGGVSKHNQIYIVYDFTFQPPGGLCMQRSTTEESHCTYKMFVYSSGVCGSVISPLLLEERVNLLHTMILYCLVITFLGVKIFPSSSRFF